TFSATLKTAGTQSITVTDAENASLHGMQSGIMVNPAAASALVLMGPNRVRAGVAFSMTVTAYDAYGNVATGYRGTLHFTSTDSTATLPSNYTFTATDAGVHVFTGIVLRKKRIQSIAVTDTLNALLTSAFGIYV